MFITIFFTVFWYFSYHTKQISKAIKVNCLFYTDGALWNTLHTDIKHFLALLMADYAAILKHIQENVTLFFFFFRFNMIQPQLIKVVTKHISAPRWLKWSPMLPRWLFWRLTAREPVYVHKISAAFTLPELSQAERVAPVPDPTGYFGNFLIWARYLFISNPFLLMSMSVVVRTKRCIPNYSKYLCYITDHVYIQYSLKEAVRRNGNSADKQMTGGKGVIDFLAQQWLCAIRETD